MGRSGVALVLACLLGCTGLAPVSPASRAGPPGPNPAPRAEAPSCAPEAAPCEPVAATEGSEEASEDEPDDGMELDTEPPPGGASPVIALGDEEIQQRLERDPSSLGPMSIGLTSAGRLMNGVEMPPGERWHTVDRGNAWGTKETVDSLIRAIDAVHARYPETGKMYVGHISGRHGGHLSPHISHQAGRDVDVSYYLTGKHAWYARATADNLDRERTWAFVRALITETDVELILIDTSVQRLLKDHALQAGESREWLDEVFQVGSKTPRPLVRHAKGHATHIHVRFYNPVAQELGRRAMPILVKLGKLKETPKQQQQQLAGFVQHRARSGDTLGSLARRYGVSVESIQRANGLRSTAIRAKAIYRIPKKGAVVTRGSSGPPKQVGPVLIPPRRLPPGDASARSGSRASPAL